MKQALPRSSPPPGRRRRRTSSIHRFLNMLREQLGRARPGRPRRPRRRRALFKRTAPRTWKPPTRRTRSSSSATATCGRPSLRAPLAARLTRPPALRYPRRGARVRAQRARRQPRRLLGYDSSSDRRRPRAGIVDTEKMPSPAPPSPGLLSPPRRLLAINGYNARLHGWGWEDQDMISPSPGSAGSPVSQGYGSTSRTATTPGSATIHLKDRWESRDRMFRQALANTTATTSDGPMKRTPRENVRGRNRRLICEFCLRVWHGGSARGNPKNCFRSENLALVRKKLTRGGKN